MQGVRRADLGYTEVHNPFIKRQSVENPDNHAPCRYQRSSTMIGPTCSTLFPAEGRCVSMALYERYRGLPKWIPATYAGAMEAPDSPSSIQDLLVRASRFPRALISLTCAPHLQATLGARVRVSREDAASTVTGRSPRRVLCALAPF